MTKLLAKLFERRRSRFRSLLRKQSKKDPSDEERSEISATDRLEDSLSEQSTSSLGLIAQLSLDGSVVSLVDVASSCQFLPSSGTSPQESILATTSTNAEERDLKKRVTFEDVTVRHYDLIVGANNKANFPLSLGWKYRQCESDTVTVEDYEDARARRFQQKVCDSIRPRLYVATDDNGAVEHYQSDVHIDQDYDDDVSEIVQLNMQERRTRLRSYGYTEEELRCAERQRKVALAMECAKYSPGEEASSVLSQPPFSYNPKFMTRYCF